MEGVADLFTVGADFDTFKRSSLYDRYFEWFTEGVATEEIEEIYKRINQEEIFKQASSMDEEKEF